MSFGKGQFLGFCLLSLSLFISIKEHVGGGITYYTIYLLVFQASFGDSVALAIYTIFVKSLLLYFFIWNKRKEDDPNAFAVDYNFLSFIYPFTIIGNVVGLKVLVLVPNMIHYFLIMTYTYFYIKKNFFRGYSKVLRKQDLDTSLLDLRGNPEEGEEARESFRKLILREKISFVSIIITFILMLFLVVMGSEVEFLKFLHYEQCSSKYMFMLVTSFLILIMISIRSYVSQLSKENMLHQMLPTKSIDTEFYRKMIPYGFLLGFSTALLGTGASWIFYLLFMKKELEFEINQCNIDLLQLLNCLGLSFQFLFLGVYKTSFLLAVPLIVMLVVLFLKILSRVESPRITNNFYWVFLSSIIANAVFIVPLGIRKIMSLESWFRLGNICV